MSIDAQRRRYQALRAERPDLFVQRGAGQYRLDPDGGEVGYEDRYVLLLKDAVINPDGREGRYLRLVAAADDAPGAVILPLSPEGVVLLDHPRHAVGASLIEAPRGFGEPGEDAETCARRELREELGVAAEALVPLGHLYPDSGLQAARVALFAARIAGVAATEAGVGHRILSPAQLEAAIADDSIRDGFTIAAFCRARLAGLV